MEIRPVYDDKMVAEVKGYGCDDDCEQYFENTPTLSCGWKQTDNTLPMW